MHIGAGGSLSSAVGQVVGAPGPIHDRPDALRKARPEVEVVTQVIHRTYGYQLQLLSKDGDIDVFGPFTSYAEADDDEQRFREPVPNENLGMYEGAEPEIALSGRYRDYLPLRRDRFVDLPEGGKWDPETKTGICRVITNQQVTCEYGRVQYISAVSGLYYDHPGAAGDISAVVIDHKTEEGDRIVLKTRLPDQGDEEESGE